jgi:LmbE family N-acetylglucosaminyl deacetylase
MNRAKGRQVLDCASPLALSIRRAITNSARGLAQSKTLACHFVQFMAAAACCLSRLPAVGQVAETPPASAILQDLRSFDTMGSVLYVAAHPDDENTQLIAYFARGRNYRTAYLSVTRGDGGQNEIGPEFGERLGLARTEELLAARKIDGGRQFFTRALDFGYSKSMDETLAIWDRQQVVADIVRVIRTFRPDVVITRFVPQPQPGNHGHHNASAVLALEAFKLAGDPKAFPEQFADGLTPWQPTRILQNSGGEGAFSIEAGGKDPVTGESFQAMAARSRAQHKTQGFGGFGGRGGAAAGTWRETFALLAGAPATNDILDSVDDTWNRVTGGAEIGKLTGAVVSGFNPQEPAASVPALLQIKKLLAPLAQDDPVVNEKRRQLDRVLQACLRLSVETVAPAVEIVPGEELKLRHSAVVASDVPVKLVEVRVPNLGVKKLGVDLKAGVAASGDMAFTVPKTTPLSQPYWLREEGTAGMFRVAETKLIGQPENPPPFSAEYVFEVGGQTLVIPDEPLALEQTGKPMRRLAVISPVSLRFGSSVALFTPGARKTVEVEVTAARPDVSGLLHVESPADWRVSPASQPFKIAKAGEKLRLAYAVTAPAQAASGSFLAVAEIGGAKFSNGRFEIRYDHIPVQLLQSAARMRVAAFDFAIRGKAVGYLPGAGDDTAESLTQLGYAVTTLTGADLTPEKLRGLDAVVIGVRAFNERTDLATNLPGLFAYVENGGTVVAQYNRPNGLKTTQLGPYNLSIAGQAPRLRVTDENSPVTFLAPEHAALTTPNHLTPADFTGWVQERGAYFPSSWDEHYTPLLAMNDSGEEPLKGGLLVAQYGKGYFVYTGLAFFRELPDGVPGAYRLFANLVSLGK